MSLHANKIDLDRVVYAQRRHCSKNNIQRTGEDCRRLVCCAVDSAILDRKCNGSTARPHRTMSVCLSLLLVFVSLCRSGYAAAVRNPLDLDHLIDLDHKYLKFTGHHSNSDVIDTFQYHFRWDKNGDYSPLKRNPSIDLNSPVCYVKNDQVKCEYPTEQKVQFYKSADDNVAVSVTNENGTMKLKGYVNQNGVISEINPLHADGMPHNRYHVIKKRWIGNIITNSVRKYAPFPTKSRDKYKDIPEVTAASDYCIDVLCVVDYSIFKKFKDAEKSTHKALEKIRYYYAHIVNGINMRFSSIDDKDLKINVRLAGYFIAMSPRDLKFIDSKRMATEPAYRVNSNFTLTQLDTFLSRLKSRGRGNTLPDYNHAMLFLEYGATNLGGTVLGTSFVGGICSDSKSTSLVVDHGAYTAAGIGCHELGHNLGVFYHDGEGTAYKAACNASRNYIMAPASYLVDESNLRYSFSFSECSLKQIKTHLDMLIKMNRNCLQCSARVRSSREDQLVDREVQGHLSTLPGTLEDVHAQCRQLYGNGSFMCPPKTPTEMCYRMYCYDPDRSACAIISEQMAAPGTPCGNMKVCKMGKCVPDSKGQPVNDECPYPDIRSPTAHCEDASPFMCAEQRFKQKCCKSCSKKFTEEEKCKDSHTIINGMSCDQLVHSIYGHPACTGDRNVPQLCCRSCKALLSGDLYGQRSDRRDRGQTKVKDNRTSSGSSNSKETCEDSTTITINRLKCDQLVKFNSQYCTKCRVRSICCKSCLPYSQGECLNY